MPNDELPTMLQTALSLSKPRSAFLAEIIKALAATKTVNLSELALSIPGEAKPDSRHRQLQRFFKDTVFDDDAVARHVMQVLDYDMNPYYLALDRTNWKYGQTEINALVLSVQHHGTAIPLYYQVVNKAGNSGQAARTALLDRFVSQFGSGFIKGLIGDREFIGSHWWQWLSEHHLPFIFRIRRDQKLHDGNLNPPRTVAQQFSGLKSGKQSRLRKPRWIGKVKVWISAKRLNDGQLLVLACSRQTANPFKVYAVRWGIEHLFQCLKGRGFRLEETRLTHCSRIKNLLSVLALAVVWAIKVGEWQVRQIAPLTYGKDGYPRKSLFRLGLDTLTALFRRRNTHPTDIMKVITLWFYPLSLMTRRRFVTPA